MNDTSNPQSTPRRKKALNVATAILVGQLWVNLPIFFIILVVSSLGIAVTYFITNIIPTLSGFFFFGFILSIIIGIAVGWLYWSYSVPRWRRWAYQNGAPEEKLQKWAVITGLVWPKGWDMEKTEFRIKE